MRILLMDLNYLMSQLAVEANRTTARNYHTLSFVLNGKVNNAYSVIRCPVLHVALKGLAAVLSI